MGKLKNRIPGSRLLISSLPVSGLRSHVESLGKQAFSKPCLVNMISKDTHLVFSIYKRPETLNDASVYPPYEPFHFSEMAVDLGITLKYFSIVSGL